MPLQHKALVLWQRTAIERCTGRVGGKARMQRSGDTQQHWQHW